MRRCIQTTALILLLAVFPGGIQAQSPSSPTATTPEQTAFKLYQQRAFAQALPIFESLYEGNRGSALYPYYLQCLLETKDFRKAEKTVEKEIRKTPNQLRLQVDLGFTYLLAGKAEKSNQVFKEAIRKLEKNPQETSPLAMAFRSRNLNAQALEAYQEGRRLLKDPNAFSLEIAGIYEATGNFREMTDAFLDILLHTPQQLNNLQSRIQFYLSQMPEDDYVEYLSGALIQRVQKYPSNTEYNEMLFWFFMNQGRHAEALPVALALVKRREEDGSRLFSLARNSLSENDFTTALAALDYLYRQGPGHPLYFQAYEELLRARYKKMTTTRMTDMAEAIRLADEIGSLISATGENLRTLELMRTQAALKIYYLNQKEEGLSLLEKALKIKGIPPLILAGCKIEFARALVFCDREWDAALQYGQVENAMPNEPIGQEAKFEYARLMYLLGEYKWARMYLEVLRGAVNKLIANDSQELFLFINEAEYTDSSGMLLNLFGKADLMTEKRHYHEALITLDSVGMLFGLDWGNDHALFKKAEIFQHLGDNPQADSLFMKVAGFYPESILADNALFRAGILRMQSPGQQARAAEAFEALIIRYPASYYAHEARQYYQKLKDAQRKTTSGST